MISPTKKKSAAVPALVIRCGIYTRKSTEEGLDQEFNTLEAQREASEAYVASQQHEGWICSPIHYDDGGFTGANMDRPALRRLMADIESGKIDCVVVYKVDRLSRSLLDFSRIIETFDKFRVAFVSVTQQFNSSTSMGRLMLHILLSFAQFERETISERTRDKMGAARRKGMWLGGAPVLGYDVVDKKLVVNEREVQLVRRIFVLYLEYGGLIPLVQELTRRGWNNKFWATRDGRPRGGKPFTKTSLHRLLTNCTYVGKTIYMGAAYEGQHQAIVEPGVWQQAQALLARNGSSGGAQVRNKFGALLKGILRCAACDCAMSPTHTIKGGNKRYRYYRCQSAQQHGHGRCPAPSIPAHEIETLVVERIKHVGSDPALVTSVLSQLRLQVDQQSQELHGELRIVERDLATWNLELQRLAGQIAASPPNSPALARLVDLQERLRRGEQRRAELEQQISGVSGQLIDDRQAALALAEFDPVWEALTPPEQVRLIQLLVERVDYDGVGGKLAITFHRTGIQSLVSHAGSINSESAA